MIVVLLNSFYHLNKEHSKLLTICNINLNDKNCKILLIQINFKGFNKLISDFEECHFFPSHSIVGELKWLPFLACHRTFWFKHSIRIRLWGTKVVTFSCLSSHILIQTTATSDKKRFSIVLIDLFLIPNTWEEDG